MSSDKRQPRIPDHVPDFASMPPAPAPLTTTVYSTGEIITFIATAMGKDTDDVADVTLICRMDDPAATTFFWNSKAGEDSTGQPVRLKLLYNVIGNALNLLRQIIEEGEEGER